MRDAHDVLRKKELDLNRVRMEVAALHTVISLLVEPSDCAEYGLAVPPNVQEIGTGSEKPMATVAELSPRVSPYGAKLIVGYPHISGRLGNRSVIRLRKIKEGLSRIMPKRMLKRVA
jgi:hypothetical protein